MTKAEVTYLMGAGFSLAEIIALEQEPKNAPAQPDQPAPAAAQPAQPAQDAQGAPEANQTQKDPAADAKPAQDAGAALAEEVRLLRETVKDLQAAALKSARQPGGSEETIEDIIAKM